MALENESLLLEPSLHLIRSCSEAVPIVLSLKDRAYIQQIFKTILPILEHKKLVLI